MGPSGRPVRGEIYIRNNYGICWNLGQDRPFCEEACLLTNIRQAVENTKKQKQKTKQNRNIEPKRTSVRRQVLRWKARSSSEDAPVPLMRGAIVLPRRQARRHREQSAARVPSRMELLQSPGRRLRKPQVQCESAHPVTVNTTPLHAKISRWFRLFVRRLFIRISICILLQGGRVTSR